jgi:hypothetical protein
MLDIQWKGKIGYGDIVSPICYAHNVSYKLDTPVSLTFRWSSDSQQKIHPQDPEPLWIRASYIHEMCEKNGTRVDVHHRFSDPLDINHTNYDWDVVGKDPFHNYWRPSYAHKQMGKYVVVNSTTNNVVSLKDYGKPWKDPIGEGWPYVIDIIKEQYDVVIVDYRTPIRELMMLLRSARGFVGYHGTAAWPAKFMHTPSILIADGGSLTRNAFPYATIKKDVKTLRATFAKMDDMFQRSADLIAKARNDYTTYHPSQQFIDHLHYAAKTI